MKITIEKNAKGDLIVWQGKKNSNVLTLGETLEQVLGLLDYEAKTYPMRTSADWRKPWRERK